MQIKENINLLPFNTFGIKSVAKKFFIIENEIELEELFNNYQIDDFFILGGGSNILLINPVYENVIYLNNHSIEILQKNESYTILEVSAGYEWHSFLEFCLINNLYGLENLALIPGKCGAAPIQNIGAYGVEQSEFFLSAEVYDYKLNKYITLYFDDCKFDYRNSIFKKQKNLIITKIKYKLKNIFEPNLEYNELQKYKNNDISALKLFNLICEIRRNKIPYPDKVFNAGSFFKNPIISSDKLNEIKKIEPKIPYFKYGSYFKISAAWLIENVGLKGFSTKDAGISEKHSLILINKGNATGMDIYKLSEYIISKVKEKFGIELEREVNLIY